VQRVDKSGDPEPGLTLDERPGIPPLVLWSGVLLLVIVGLAFRLHGLGRLGLFVDEGNQAIAIAGILEHGIPVSDSGWPYSRSLLFQYIQAASALGLGLDEFSLRLPSALFGAASIFTSFILARALFGDQVALLTATLVCLSLWEISLSRWSCRQGSQSWPSRSYSGDSRVVAGFDRCCSAPWSVLPRFIKSDSRCSLVSPTS
jgi:hypothetical protein